MSKSPEEYFQEQHFAPEPHTRGVTFSTAEIAFMRKYMGLDAQETLEKLGIKAEVPGSLEPARPAPAAEPAPEAVGPEAQDRALPSAAPEFELSPVPAEVVSSPAGAPGGSELSAAAQALSAAASALTAAASALSGTSLAPALEPASFAEPALEVSASASAPEPAPEDVFAEPEPVVEAEAEFVIEPVAEPKLAVEPKAAVAPEPVAAPEAVAEEAPSEPENAAPAVMDRSEVETFKETVDQQFMTIRAALAGLKQSGSDTSLSDALFRGITTVQTSASYMGLEEIRVYAERTAGIVDQGRKTGIDFSVMTDLLEQEAGIIEDMVFKAISETLDVAAFASAGQASSPPQPPAPEVPAAPMEETAPEAPAVAAEKAVLPPPAPEASAEPVAEAAPTPPPAPAPAKAPVYVEAPPADLHGEMAEEEPLDAILRREPELQMVGFYIGKQEFTVPTMAVQEVIRYEVPAKMPAAPRFVAGVINLRGKMTPLVHLRDMLEIRQGREAEDRFIIVCRRKGLQIGLIIERVHTMYRVPQADIEWGIEGLLGISNADFISGLLKLHESLVGIVSVDRIIDHVLE